MEHIEECSRIYKRSVAEEGVTYIAEAKNSREAEAKMEKVFEPA